MKIERVRQKPYTSKYLYVIRARWLKGQKIKMRYDTMKQVYRKTTYQDKKGSHR